MKNRRNYYRVLQVQPDVPTEIIRASYRALMHTLKTHPDLGGDHWRAAIINEAFATLSDPERRAAYDRTLKDGIDRLRRHNDPASPSTAAPPAPAHVSLLPPARRQEASPATKRAFERLPRRMRVSCAESTRPDERVSMTTENISIDGVLLLSPRELSTGQRLRIQCSFFDAVGLVTHVAADPSSWRRRWRAGVQFLTLHFKQSRGVFLALEG
jgi:curved DNA-binding protein CbpA